MFNFFGKFGSHFVRVFIVLEILLQVFQLTTVRNVFFDYLGHNFCLFLLWYSTDILLLLLIFAGFFSYLRKKPVYGMFNYVRWLLWSFIIAFFWNFRVFFFFKNYSALLIKFNIFEFDFGTCFIRACLIILSLIFLMLLYTDICYKRLFILELPFLSAILLWFFIISIHSINFLFLFLIMESITILLVILISVYFIFFGARLLKPVIQFFIINLVISTFFLLGLSLLFFFIPVSSSENLMYVMSIINFWVLNFSGIIDPFIFLFIFKFSLACMLLPFLFKLTLAPFSIWVVNIYSRLPVLFLLILMGIYKLVYFFIFIKLFIYIFDLMTQLQPVLILSLFWFVVPSMFVGCLAYRATDLKTIIAYTTVSQMSYVVAGVLTHDSMAIKYSLLYLLIYVLNISAIFIIFVKLQKEFYLVNLNQLFLIKYYSKKYFFILFILFCSIAGFPPFAGFFLKYFLFLHIYKSGFFILAIFGVISGYIMSIIYLQLLIELCMFKMVSWTQYQQPLLSSMGLDRGFKNVNILLKNIHNLFIFFLFFILTLNFFFFIFIPWLSFYCGCITFFFTYGLFSYTELPEARIEMSWFANNFQMMTTKDFDLTTSTVLDRIAAVNIAIDTVAFTQQYMNKTSSNKFLEKEMYRNILWVGREKMFGQEPIHIMSSWVFTGVSLEEYMSPLILMENGFKEFFIAKQDKDIKAVVAYVVNEIGARYGTDEHTGLYTYYEALFSFDVDNNAYFELIMGKNLYDIYNPLYAPYLYANDSPTRLISKVYGNFVDTVDSLRFRDFCRGLNVPKPAELGKYWVPPFSVLHAGEVFYSDFIFDKLDKDDYIIKYGVLSSAARSGPVLSIPDPIQRATMTLVASDPELRTAMYGTPTEGIASVDGPKSTPNFFKDCLAMLKK